MEGFCKHDLDATFSFYEGKLPDAFVFSSEQFETLWKMHPAEFHEIMMHGRLVKTPRWQQAYGADYHYTGRVNEALPMPAILQPLVDWCQATIASELNGVLLNWYDLNEEHYIGKHRDSTKHMLKGAPIVTISFGEERTFRLRPWKESGRKDFSALNGTVFVMPYDTNLAWTHEIPKTKKINARRISVTLRAFTE